MGISHSWYAVRASREAVLQQLAMETSDELGQQYPHKGIAVADLPGGWVVVLTDRYDAALKAPLVGLASLGPAVACLEDERVMYSEARGYEAGVEVWRVIRDCEDEPYMSLQVTGAPPPQFEKIRDELFAEQEAEGGEDAGVDLIFDGPPRLAQSVCGFRMQEELPEGSSFTMLRKAGGKGGLFGRLFGRR